MFVPDEWACATQYSETDHVQVLQFQCVWMRKLLHSIKVNSSSDETHLIPNEEARGCVLDPHRT